MTDILAALKEKTASAPAQQRKLSEYILSNSNYVCLMTVKELSEKSGVGRATIMRLVERLGYASYSDFKRDLNDANLTYFDSDKLANPFIWPHQGMAAEKSNSVDACCQESVWLIQQVAEKLDREVFDNILNLLASAKRVNVAGFRTSRPLARYFFYQMQYFLENIRDLSDSESLLYDRVFSFQPGDVLFILGVSPVTTTSVRAARLCRERNIPVVVLVDDPDCTIYKLANYGLLIPRTDSTRQSAVPLMVVLESIINEVGSRMALLSIPNLNTMNKFLLDENILSD